MSRAILRDLIGQLEALEDEMAALRAENDAALTFLEREGYRRCDAPACNCGAWHRWRTVDA